MILFDVSYGENLVLLFKLMRVIVRYDIISFFLAKMINLRDVEKCEKIILHTRIFCIINLLVNDYRLYPFKIRNTARIKSRHVFSLYTQR